MSGRFPWKSYNALLSQCIGLVVRTAVDDYPDETFYGVALHAHYAERHATIDLPCLAVNSEEEESARAARWNPADWPLSDIEYETVDLRRLHRRLVKYAVSGSVKHWDKCHGRYVDALVEATKAVRVHLRGAANAKPSLAAIVISNDDFFGVVKRCVDTATFKREFAGFVPEVDEEAFTDKILDQGAASVPWLLQKLDSQQDWQAADMLGRLGERDSTVIEALRAGASKLGETRFHEATALALLGDTEFLFDLAASPPHRTSLRVAVRGLMAPYSVAANDCRFDIPLDYDAAERLFATPNLKGKAKDLWSNGRQIARSDVSTALAALTSKHASIRAHALCTLGDRSLGAKLAPKITQAIVNCFDDRSANVRRLAVINLSYWKKGAAGYKRELRSLFDDRDADVADAARHYSRELSSL